MARNNQFTDAHSFCADLEASQGVPSARLESSGAIDPFVVARRS